MTAPVPLNALRELFVDRFLVERRQADHQLGSRQRLLPAEEMRKTGRNA